MKEKVENKFISLAVKQNLLLWHVSKDLVEMDVKIEKSSKKINLKKPRKTLIKKFFKRS